MLHFKTLYQLPYAKCIELSAKYNHAYSEKDYNCWPAISFPIFSCFKYIAGKDNYLLTSNEILFEKGDLEFEVTKLPMFNCDTTVTLQFQDSENESIKSFLRKNSTIGISKRTPQTDHIILELTNPLASELYKEHCLIELLNTIRYQPAQEARIKINAYSLKLIEQARQYIFANFHNKIQIADIAAFVYISPFHFCRLFKKITGFTPYHYLLMVRLKEAKKLLIKGESITQAAFKTGFQSLDHFSHAFLQHEKISPSNLKKLHLPD